MAVRSLSLPHAVSGDTDSAIASPGRHNTGRAVGKRRHRVPNDPLPSRSEHPRPGRTPRPVPSPRPLRCWPDAVFDTRLGLSFIDGLSTVDEPRARRIATDLSEHAIAARDRYGARDVTRPPRLPRTPHRQPHTGPDRAGRRMRPGPRAYYRLCCWRTSRRHWPG
jgi:hypothetical protein